jgi:hypothetical protein
LWNEEKSDMMLQMTYLNKKIAALEEQVIDFKQYIVELEEKVNNLLPQEIIVPVSYEKTGFFKFKSNFF